MATDFVHTAEVVDAVISVLKGADGDTHTGGLPSNWFEAGDDGDEVWVQVIQHGDLRDLVLTDDLDDRLPCILVRGTGTQPLRTTTQSQECWEPVRIVHARRFADCRDSDGEIEKNITRARERYAKAIHTALFNDPNRKLATINSEGERSEVDLTTSDTSADVVTVEFGGWDLGQDPGSGTPETTNERVRADRIMVVAVDIRVKTITTE